MAIGVGGGADGGGGDIINISDRSTISAIFKRAPVRATPKRGLLGAHYVGAGAILAHTSAAASQADGPVGPAREAGRAVVGRKTINCSSESGAGRASEGSRT